MLKQAKRLFLEWVYFTGMLSLTVLKLNSKWKQTLVLHKLHIVKRSAVPHKLKVNLSASLVDVVNMVTYMLSLNRMKKVQVLNSSIKSSVDRKSTRLNSSHVSISYAVFCFKKNIF